MMQSESSVKTANIEQIKESVRNKIWRISHSSGSVKTFNEAIISFEKYMKEKALTYDDILKSPIDILDDFGAWLDIDHEASVIRLYIHMVKKLSAGFGIKIDRDEFRDRVTLPKKRMLQDDKVNEDHIRRIVLATKNQRLKLLLMLNKDTPGRPGETLGLKREDFNTEYDPPYFSIPEYLAKNDIPRELFFTPETKQTLLSYCKNKGITDPKQYIFLKGKFDDYDERSLQEAIRITEINLAVDFREVMSKPEFVDINQRIEKRRGRQPRYRIHIYSFKKFAFTRIADTLGEIAARALKGDKEYVLTYYKKSREERAEDYGKMIPKLSVFVPDDQARIRDKVEDAIKTLKKEDLAGLLDHIRGIRQARR